MAKKELDDSISLEEAKAAIKFCKTFGGREAIVEYLQPLREFIKYFGTLERFDYVLERTHAALGVEATKGVVTEEAVNVDTK